MEDDSGITCQLLDGKGLDVVRKRYDKVMKREEKIQKKSIKNFIERIEYDE